MSWTAKQARYNGGTQVVVRDEARLARHYVLTRHGAVARTFVPGRPGNLLAEVALLRRGNRHAQYQGTVTAVDGQWVAATPSGEVVATCANYLDAEAALLPRRNRARAWGDYRWPASIVAALRAPRAAQCTVCGTEVDGYGNCPRAFELHWTAASLAVQREQRAARRALAACA